MDEFKIDISKPITDFENHLALANNKRILFSAPFGSGKTYFLNEFYQKRAKTFKIHLYPVNYSVASNEDIFELIKFDILFNLLESQLIDLEDTDFSHFFAVQFFLIEDSNNILKTFSEYSSDIGKSIINIVDNVVKLQEKYLKFKKGVESTNIASITTYLKSFAKKSGSIYEEDFYTLIILNLIDQLKLKGQEVILIVDDLDRIDPEHTFRLLNVFGAHFDLQNDENKFGFDQIILSCDIDNIRNIFHVRYGLNTDFTGYIDKFYSKEVFIFNNKKIVADTIKKLLASINADENTEKVILFKRDNSLKEEIEFILKSMTYSNSVSLRSLVKLNCHPYTLKDIFIEHGRSSSPISIENIFLLPTFEFLEFVLGTKENLKFALDKTAETYAIHSFDEINRDPFLFRILCECLSVFISDTVIVTGGMDKIQHHHAKRGLVFIFTRARGINGYMTNTNLTEIHLTSGSSLEPEINLFELLSDAFEKYQALKKVTRL